MFEATLLNAIQNQFIFLALALIEVTNKDRLPCALMDLDINLPSADPRILSKQSLHYIGYENNSVLI